MPKIHAVSTYSPPHQLSQEKAEEFIHHLFKGKMERLERYLKVFKNGEILKRQLAMPVEWYMEEHTFAEKNDLYIELATEYGCRVIQDCIAKVSNVEIADIDAIFFISTTGISTPSIDARIMNQLAFPDDVVRIPIWGLGCGGGAAGISRANDYCLAHKEAIVLVICLELCSLTFQPSDLDKSNFVGTSLFGDGVSCAIVAGDQAKLKSNKPLPAIQATASKILPHSEDVMGWRIEDDGLHVIFAKSIPSIIEKWLTPFVKNFLQKNSLSIPNISRFIAHPGGKKVLAAYESALELSKKILEPSAFILQQHGNMSSPTVLYVLKHVMEQQPDKGELGIMTSLGPGFSGELVLLKWE